MYKRITSDDKFTELINNHSTISSIVYAVTSSIITDLYSTVYYDSHKNTNICVRYDTNRDNLRIISKIIGSVTDGKLNAGLYITGDLQVEYTELFKDVDITAAINRGKSVDVFEYYHTFFCNAFRSDMESIIDINQCNTLSELSSDVGSLIREILVKTKADIDEFNNKHPETYSVFSYKSEYALDDGSVCVLEVDISPTDSRDIGVDKIKIYRQDTDNNGNLYNDTYFDTEDLCYDGVLSSNMLDKIIDKLPKDNKED